MKTRVLSWWRETSSWRFFEGRFFKHRTGRTLVVDLGHHYR